MSYVIWKYSLSAVMPDRNEISMPTGSIVLHVGTQEEQVFIWVRVDPDAPIVARRFAVYATGQPIGDVDWYGYVGTVQQKLPGLTLVWHVFDCGEPHLEPRRFHS